MMGQGKCPWLSPVQVVVSLGGGWPSMPSPWDLCQVYLCHFPRTYFQFLGVVVSDGTSPDGGYWVCAENPFQLGVPGPSPRRCNVATEPQSQPSSPLCVGSPVACALKPQARSGAFPLKKSPQGPQGRHQAEYLVRPK